MANELRMTISVNVKKGNVNENISETFVASLTNAEGPTPGYVVVPQLGVDVDLSELTTPGVCVIKNVHATYSLMVGISDGVEFYPMFNLAPGESCGGPLSQFIGTSLDATGTGTGTYDTGTYTLHLVGLGGASAAQVKAFGR